MAETSIEWASRVWNPVVGCTAVSPGCENCYAEKLAARHVLMSAARGTRSPYLRVVDTEHRRWTRIRDAASTPDTHRRVELLPERLLPALKFKAGELVFAVSMGDPFHADVPFEFVEQMWAAMAASPATLAMTASSACGAYFFTSAAQSAMRTPSSRVEGRGIAHRNRRY